MESTYTIYFSDILVGNNKSMFALFNPAASGKIIKCYRAGLMNMQLAAVTGVILNFALRTISASSSGTSVDFLKHDLSEADTPDTYGITATTGGTITYNQLIRRIAWSTDEISISYGIEEYEMQTAYNIIWDGGYCDSSIQPLTLRPGEGVGLRCETNTVIGLVDIWSEITMISET